MRTELLPRLVRQQAARDPGAPAVLADGTATSYRELDRRSSQIADFLLASGAGRGSVVGVCLPRGADLVAALLGVWRAGGAYLPLDPGLPDERIAWMIADSGATAVLGGDRDGGHVRGGARWLPVGAGLASAPAADPAADGQAAPASGAYVIYTSGSTGTPKGVMISHGGIANRVLWNLRVPGIGAADRVLQKTSISFDAAAWEIFAPLVSGGTVVMAPAGAERDPAMIVREIAAHQVTVLQVVPSVLRLLVDEPGLAECGSLRMVFSAGEPLQADLCQRLLSRLDVQLWNTYGPTECSIDVTAQPFDVTQRTGQVAIGRPLANVRTMVLDPNGGLVPVGVAGELHASGAGVGLGYAGRPGLTAERFVPDPYGPPGSRMYRTGDLARWRTDGALEFLGRADDQVKVNGVRVEPAEIEAVLARDPAVRAAVVLAREDRSGNKRLIAYVVPAGDEHPAAATLRAHAARALPEYMVPAKFRILPQLPLTTSGKVNRVALLAMGEDAGRPPYRAPRTPVERVVARVWAELLGAGRVGLDDDFFALGGHSLLLARLSERLMAASGAQVDVKDLFGASTVRSQAKLVSRGEQPGSAISRVPRDAPMPLSSGQQRLWFLDQLFPGSPEYVVPMLLRLPGDVTPEDARRALAAVAAAHESLRTRYVTDADAPYQVADPPGPVELTVVDATEQGLGKALQEEIGRGFDLEHGPLWRALLVQLPSGEQVLAVTVHHIACDGRSMVVLKEELERACHDARHGREPACPAREIDYVDYVAWQRQRLTPTAVDQLLDYWRDSLNGLQVLELPTDHPRPVRRDPSGAMVSFDLPPEPVRRLVAASRTLGATPFVTLLTVFSTLLARYSRQWDVPVGVPLSSRDRPETQDVVGFFLNSMVLRCELSPELTFRQAVALLRDRCAEAFAHQDLPFDRLVDELRPARDQSRTPLYQVMFGFLEEGHTAAPMSAADIDVLEEAWLIAKTDLSLFIQQQPDGTMGGAFEYARSLFDRDTVQRMTGHFRRLVEAFAADPDVPIGAPDLLDPQERRQLLTEWSGPVSGLRSATIAQAFAEQAARSPAATAVITEDTSLSYGELNARASRLARYLIGLGAGPERIVAVAMLRGEAMVVALLAVLKTGAAYLPVNPDLPAGRMAFMLGQALPVCTLTTADVASSLPGREVPEIVLDAPAVIEALSAYQDGEIF